MKGENNLFPIHYILICCLSVMCIPVSLFSQKVYSFIENPVDNVAYKNILEYYSYDDGMDSDPVSYGEWPWRGPHILHKISYRSVREQRVSAYLAIPNDKKADKLPIKNEKFKY